MSTKNEKMQRTNTGGSNVAPTGGGKLKRPSNIGVAGLVLPNAALNNGTQKLSSLTPMRDLSLGGRGGGGIAKKVFTPNLNVVRNKNGNVKTSKDTTARGRGGRTRTERGGRGGNCGRGGRGGANASLIQTTGVFSEGAGALLLRKAISNSTSASRSDESPSSMRKPTLIKSENKKVDLKADAAHVHALLGDSDEDDFADEKTDVEYIPIKLNEAKWKSVKTEIKLDKPDTGGFDPEASLNSNEFISPIAQRIQSMHVRQQEAEERQCTMNSLDELLRANQPQLFLLQLPDTLPCEDESKEEPLCSSSKMNTVMDASLPPPASKCTKSLLLNEMEEGKIGKLLRYKSGKTKLIFGDCHFDLSMGMTTGFLQDLMSINTNREERSGNMINLGSIQAKLTATPDWEQLLQQERSQEHA